eukprot:scaffold86844_cov12-Tisochrysis_lutea.AAC.1
MAKGKGSRNQEPPLKPQQHQQQQQQPPASTGEVGLTGASPRPTPVPAVPEQAYAAGHGRESQQGHQEEESQQGRHRREPPQSPKNAIVAGGAIDAGHAAVVGNAAGAANHAGDAIANGVGPGQEPVELATLLARARAANTIIAGSVPF